MKNGMEAVADVLNCIVSKGTSGVCRVAHVLLFTDNSWFVANQVVGYICDVVAAFVFADAY